MLFSHEALRPQQKELAETIQTALKEKRHCLVHAPTGLGKTAAALCAALDVALGKDLTIVFLTSRHTQHKIVLDTVRKFNERNNQSVVAISMIGKKNMCAQEVDNLPSSDFAEYCKTLVEGNQCEFYTNARGKNNFAARNAIANIKTKLPLPAEEVHKLAVMEKVCPYEIALMLAEEAKVIVADYNYLFHPHIRDSFLAKIKKKLEQIVIVVDEAHNLPSRLRDMQTFRLTNRQMKLAIAEAKKLNSEVISNLVEIQEVLNVLSERLSDGGERLVREKEFVDLIEKFKKFDVVVEELAVAAEEVRSSEKVSHIGSVAKFLQEWKGKGEGFASIMSRNDMLIMLSNRCLDPSILTKDVFRDCYSAAVMSGTLEPLDMYTSILGLDGAVNGVFESPFPKDNRLVIVVPKTTTKYQARSDRQFDDIAKEVANIANSVPGCLMVFFPSYFVQGRVGERFAEIYNKDVFWEKSSLSKEEKQNLLDRFSAKKDKGAVLLAVASGSFGEGVDLPGILKGVIVVGLPLDKPDLETNQLIEYYDKKFGKGWEFGYILPAMTRCVQNAGRCIRTEKDRGIIAFIDERYAWPRYQSCFPKEWSVITTREPKDFIGPFFGRLA